MRRPLTRWRGRVIYALADLKTWADLGIKESTSDPGFRTVLPASQFPPPDALAQQLLAAGLTWCARNDEEASKDAEARAELIAGLERKLGDKALVANKGYRRFLTTPDQNHFTIDRERIAEDARDCVFVLRTNIICAPT